jgi:hypothetical protein
LVSSLAYIQEKKKMQVRMRCGIPTHTILTNTFANAKKHAKLQSLPTLKEVW